MDERKMIYLDDALKAIRKLLNDAPTAQHVSAMFDCEDAIQALPSAQTERKKGKWIFPYETTTMVSICSECGAHGKGNFCPNCGADMRGEQE